MGKPWWTEETIQKVDELLKPTFKVFEFGSGCSTAWIARRVKEIWTLENDEDWFRKIMDDMRDDKLKINLHFADIAKPEYMETILKFPDETFDFIVVDGAFRRVEAFERSIPKLKHGGYILLDDSQNLSWMGCHHVRGVSHFWDSPPAPDGKTATIFTRP